MCVTFLSYQLARADLSLSHINLRTLTAHFDELHTLLGNLKIPFDFIGITETKPYKDNDFLTNVTIQNYNMYCQSSSRHAGGVALYVTLVLLNRNMKPYGPKLKIKNEKVFYAVAHIGIAILTFLNLLNI